MTLRRDLIRAGLAALLVAGALVSLTRVFSTTSWVPVTGGAMLLSLALAAGTRALGLPLLGSAVTTLVGLLAFTYTQHLSPGPLLPGGAQLSEAHELFQRGLLQFRDEPAPTVPLDGLLLITSTSAWMVAWMTHELLVRWRSIGLAMLPSGVLWVVPLAVPLPPGRTWPQAVGFAAAAATTLLFEGDGNVLGTATSADRSERVAPRGRALLVGSVIAALAIGGAAFAPGVLPGYDAAAWWDLSPGSDPHGYQPIVDIGDRLKLPEPADIMTVHADRKVYLRLAALDSFDGTTWKVGPPGATTFQPSSDALFPADGQLPREVPMGETVDLVVDVEVLDLENIYVPVPYQPIRLEGDGVRDMVYSTEGGFVAAGNLADNEIGGRQATGIRPGTSYTVRSVLPAASYETLRDVQYPASSVARWTTLPRDYSPLAVTAQEVYEAAGATTAIDKAFALQTWFTGPDSDFRYSLDVDVLRGDAALEDFLYVTRTGYCEYFATAMAVMLRATGIPARVAVGFLAGHLTLPADPGVGRLTNTYTVSTSDAHAWVEVLFPGVGWVRFEPTPRSDGSVQPPTPEDLDPVLTSFEQRLLELQNQPATEEVDPTARPSSSPSDRDLSQLNDEDVGLAEQRTAARRLPIALLVLAALAVVASLPAWRFRGSPQQRGTPRQRIRLAQRRLHRLAAAYGVPRRPSETAADLAARWIAEGRAEPAAAERFTALVQDAVFRGPAGHAPDESVAREAERLAEALHLGLRRSVTTRDRVVAPWRAPVAATRGLVERARRFWTQAR